ncbi:amino acid permease [Streptomyces erythrochromogenes]|uniref:APC family permease n=1 Tax=Streptomyces erythrochromogenes TaxID=285574 RepID=UPI003637D28E
MADRPTRPAEHGSLLRWPDPFGLTGSVRRPDVRAHGSLRSTDAAYVHESGHAPQATRPPGARGGRGGRSGRSPAHDGAGPADHARDQFRRRNGDLLRPRIDRAQGGARRRARLRAGRRRRRPGALCYAELAGAVPVSGGTYSYAYASLGEGAAYLVAWCLILEYGVAVATVAVSWGQYLGEVTDADPNEQGNSRRWIIREVENSLRRLGTDHRRPRPTRCCAAARVPEQTRGDGEGPVPMMA